MPRTFMSGEARWFPEGALAELPDIEADRDAFDIRRYEMQPGDAIFFDFLTVHGAPGFPFDGRRRVLSLRYLSDEARHAPRRWVTSPPFDGLEAELPAGAEMDHPLFPVVYTELTAIRPAPLARPRPRSDESKVRFHHVRAGSSAPRGLRRSGVTDFTARRRAWRIR